MSDTTPSPSPPGTPGRRKPSICNSGQGIRYVVTFTPLVSKKAKKSSNPKKKPKKNKKTNTVEDQSFAFHLHEDASVFEFLTSMYNKAGREDLLDFCAVNRETGRLPDNVTIFYVVPKVETTKLPVKTISDFKDMEMQAQRKGEPEAKVFVTEVKKAKKQSRANADGSGDGESNSSSESEESESSDDGGKKRKKGKGSGKKKNQDVSPEEAEEVALIKKLQERHRCNDRTCGNDTCYVHAGGKHVHLDKNLLVRWAQAMKGDNPKATLEEPPNTYHFQSEGNSALVQARLTRNAAGQAQDFGGLLQGVASLFATLQSNNASSSANNGNKPVNQSRRTRLPKISLDEFCLAYELSNIIKQKLTNAKITGPHALNHLKDEVLLGMVGLETGELADLRDAHEDWVETVSEN